MRQETLLEYLLAGNVDLVLVGGMAAVAHGATVVTRDLDVCVPLVSDNFLRLQAALGPVHPLVRAGRDRVPLALDPGAASRLNNLYVLTDLGNVDCLGEVAGIGDYAAALSRSVEIRFFDRPCHVLGLEALIEAKEAMGRPSDLLTVTELRAIQEKKQLEGGS